MFKLELTDEMYTVLTMALVDARRYRQQKAVQIMKLADAEEDEPSSWNDTCRAEAERLMEQAHQVNEVRRAMLAATELPDRLYAGVDKKAAHVSEAQGRQRDEFVEEDPIRRIWLQMGRHVTASGD